MEERINVTEITRERLENYREYLNDEERSQATIEKYLRDVRSFQKDVYKRQIWNC